jgi:hypothetical protein
MSVYQASYALYVGRVTVAKCGLQASNIKINAQQEEWINTRIIICTPLRVYLSVYCCKKDEYMMMGKMIIYTLGCCVFIVRQSLSRSRHCE